MSKEKILKTYARFDVTAVHGEGCLIYDKNGKEYIDFVSGVAVNCLGHCHPAIINAIQEQSHRLMHVSNLYWNEEQMELADKLCQLSGLEGAFFCNSGTEAVEAAVKFARKYGKLKGGNSKHGIIYMNNSFHGRTLGALSITGQVKYQKDYTPLIPGVKSIELNDIDMLKAEMDPNICAIVVEPIQGEGGVVEAEKSFLGEAKKLCEKYDALLIFDEVQCGIGRLGSLFAFEKFGVTPDLICIAKGLGGGFPIGAVVASGKAAESISYGDHGSTFGGNPLACKVALAILEELLEKGVLANVEPMGRYFVEKLQVLKKKHESIKSIRGMGLLLGLQLSIDTKEFIDRCIASGLLLVGAGADVVRILPPLNIREEYIDRAVDIIDSVLSSK
ncbi:MAG: aspartate aminotransferase family protein [Clostridiaceae bacterium]|jgi:acetylornithine/N-succinyldiaminopimelate aminotransferase|nr:aspartate aminotransferase family protein [Clostridiaceae bacterium]